MPDGEDLPPIAWFDADPHGVASAYRAASAAVYDREQQGWFDW